MHSEGTPYNDVHIFFFSTEVRHSDTSDFNGRTEMELCVGLIDQQQPSEFLLIFDILVVLTLYNWVYISLIQKHHSSVAESSLS